jgi:hypothetical protein
MDRFDCASATLVGVMGRALRAAAAAADDNEVEGSRRMNADAAAVAAFGFAVSFVKGCLSRRAVSAKKHGQVDSIETMLGLAGRGKKS